MDYAVVLLIRGIVGIAAGVTAMLWPGLTLAVLVLLFGAYALVDGVANVFMAAARVRTGERPWATFFQGLVGIAAGIVMLVSPLTATLALIFWIAAWAVITGVLELAALGLRQGPNDDWRLAFRGIASVLFGSALFIFPVLGAVSLAWVLGAYAVVSGILLVDLAIRLRRPVTP